MPVLNFKSEWLIQGHGVCNIRSSQSSPIQGKKRCNGLTPLQRQAYSGLRLVGRKSIEESASVDRI